MACSYNSKTRGVSALQSNYTAISLDEKTYNNEFPILPSLRVSKLKRKKSACRKLQIQQFPDNKPIQVQSIKDYHDDPKRTKCDKLAPQLQSYNVRLILGFRKFGNTYLFYL